MPSETDIGRHTAARVRTTDGAGTSVLEMSWRGGPVIGLESGGARAMIALRGGQVLSWEVPDLGEQLWLSPLSRLDQERPARGGIPVCWPWFGPHPHDASKPAHGFARARSWQPQAMSSHAGSARVTLELERSPADAALWPQAARLVLDVEIAENTLALALTTTNEGDAQLPVSQALHTYFRVADIASACVVGLDRRDYVDKLDAGVVKRQSGPVTFDREVDRIYFGDTTPLQLLVPEERRRVEIASTGSGSAVVWNPWIEKSARLGDMGPDGYRHMVCVETANAGPDLRTIRAGEHHTLAVRYAALPHAAE